MKLWESVEKTTLSLWVACATKHSENIVKIICYSKRYFISSIPLNMNVFVVSSVIIHLLRIIKIELYAFLSVRFGAFQVYKSIFIYCKRKSNNCLDLKILYNFSAGSVVRSPSTIPWPCDRTTEPYTKYALLYITIIYRLKYLILQLSMNT